MLRILLSTIVLGLLGLTLPACESTNMATQDQFNQSLDTPDLTGVSQGDPGWTDQEGTMSGTASER